MSRQIQPILTRYRKAILAGLAGFTMIVLLFAALWVIADRQEREYQSLPEPKADNDGLAVMMLFVIVLAIPVIIAFTGVLAAIILPAHQHTIGRTGIASGIAGGITCVITGVIGGVIAIIFTAINIVRRFSEGDIADVSQLIADMLVGGFWIACFLLMIFIVLISIAIFAGMVVWVMERVVIRVAKLVKPSS